MKVLVEIYTDNGVNNAVTIKRSNSVIALREYGQRAADPQVVCEMWRLQQLLVREDRLREAAEIGQESQGDSNGTFRILLQNLHKIHIDRKSIKPGGRRTL